MTAPHPDPQLFRTSTEQDTPAKIIAIALGVLSAGYFVPGSVATYRNTDNQALVWWLSALTSWTVIGWFVALILAAQRTQKHRLSTEKTWPARHPVLLTGAVVFPILMLIGIIAPSGSTDAGDMAASGPFDACPGTPAVVVPCDVYLGSESTVGAPEPVAESEQPEVVLDESHSGAESTANFAVEGRYQVEYTYDCGSTTNFSLDVFDASTGVLLDTLVNTIDASGSDSLSKRSHSMFGGSEYYIESYWGGCDWAVKVTDLPD